MTEHPLHNLMKTSMESLKNIIDVDTIVGQPVKTDAGETIIPVSKVTFGFAAGGSEFEGKKPNCETPPFGGGTGGGVSITPIAFLIVNSNGVELKHVEEKTHLFEKVLEQVPKAINSIVGELEKDNHDFSDDSWD
ncbi:MAG TPA: sporulation protein YtfJ [Firmicutes bacterium]|nr:sporulation protein YtfJ [Bacillota bacterium]